MSYRKRLDLEGQGENWKWRGTGDRRQRENNNQDILYDKRLVYFQLKYVCVNDFLIDFFKFYVNR